MSEAVVLIQEVGFPIAAALGLGWFIYKLIMRIVDGKTRYFNKNYSWRTTVNR
jgi:hypothetical protein